MAKYTRLILLMICATALATSMMACKMLSRLAGGGLLTGSSQPVLKTAAGELVIAGVEISDRFPPGCSASLTCSSARSGYQIVILWLEKPEGGNVTDISDDLFGEVVNYLGENNKQAYLTASNGARCGLASIQVFEKRFGLAFGAPEGTKGYILTWPGNPDIELAK